MASNISKQSKETLVRIDGKADPFLGGKFSIRTLLYLWLRSATLIQGSFNYGYYQGTGYAACIYPFLKRIYKSNKEKLKQSLIDNIEFYNTSPYSGIMVITTLHLFMLQTGSSDSEVRTVKFALMGPLAGIGDSLFNFGAQPLVAGIAASLSANGSWTGFWFYMIVFNAIQIAAGITLTLLTYRAGQKFITNITSVMSSIVKIASMIGITIIAALAITYTKITMDLGYVSTIISQGIISMNGVTVQQVLDQFLPLMLPIALVVFIYMMMTKYSWSIYKSLVFILLLGVTGYVFGIFV